VYFVQSGILDCLTGPFIRDKKVVGVFVIFFVRRFNGGCPLMEPFGH
jgi:hypothetical protein